MAAKKKLSVMIEWSAVRSITETFSISFDKQIFPAQLIYRGKTTQKLPRFEFPKDFSLSTNPKSFKHGWTT